MANLIKVSLQEDVPDYVFRTDDNFSSDSDPDDNDEENDVSEESNVEFDNGEEFESKENPGWADAMSKILKTNPPKGKKSVVLSKAKTLNDVLKEKKTSDVGFVVEGETKEEKPNIDSIKIENEKQRDKSIIRTKRREWSLKARIKPSILEKNRERTLAKIATKGVVQLFNTVKEHQMKINRQLAEAGSERKKEKVLKTIDKNAFLDLLMGPTGRTKSNLANHSETEMKQEEDKKTWDALRDDFMIGGTMKDWDKKTDENQFSEIKDDVDMEGENNDGNGSCSDES